MSIVVLEEHPNGTLTLVSNLTPVMYREAELVLDLGPGTYIIVPRTSGGLMNKPSSFPESEKNPSIIDKNMGDFTPLFKTIIRDIFNKFDLFISHELNNDEFNFFYNCTSESLEVDLTPE